MRDASVHSYPVRREWTSRSTKRSAYLLQSGNCVRGEDELACAADKRNHRIEQSPRPHQTSGSNVPSARRADENPCRRRCVVRRSGLLSPRPCASSLRQYPVRLLCFSRIACHAECRAHMRGVPSFPLSGATRALNAPGSRSGCRLPAVGAPVLQYNCLRRRAWGAPPLKLDRSPS